MYKIPEFPIECEIYTSQVFDPAGPRLLSPVNVALGRRVHVSNSLIGTTGDPIVTFLLFPPGTDVRDDTSSTGPDGIICPTGSGRTYAVLYVNDLGSGFANEHRFAVCIKGPNWPTPLPPIFNPAGLTQLRVELPPGPMFGPTSRRVRTY